MTNSSQTLRNYRKSDNLMMTQAASMLNSFESDVELFEARVTDMTLNYSSRFSQFIDTARMLADDSSVVDELQLVTVNLTAKLYAARQLHQTLMFYVKRSFPDEPVLYEYFGAKDYNFARRTVERMMNLLYKSHRAAGNDEYKTKLLATGLKQTDMDRLNTLAEELRLNNIHQEDLKKRRRLLTQQRVTALNAVWQVMTEINAASAVIFAGDYAKQQEYALYPEGDKAKAAHKGPGSLGGRLTDAEGNPVIEATVKVQGTNITVTTDTAGEYFIEELTEGTYTLLFTATGYKLKTLDKITITEGETMEVDVKMEEEG